MGVSSTSFDFTNKKIFVEMEYGVLHQVRAYLCDGFSGKGSRFSTQSGPRFSKFFS